MLKSGIQNHFRSQLMKPKIPAFAGSIRTDLFNKKRANVWHGLGNEDKLLRSPAIICTEFVANDMKQYRMIKWMDSQTIFRFGNYRGDSPCDKWFSPIDDGVKMRWNNPNYLSNYTGVVKVIDKDMNLDDKKIDFSDFVNS